MLLTYLRHGKITTEKSLPALNLSMRTSKKPTHWSLTTGSSKQIQQKFSHFPPHTKRKTCLLSYRYQHCFLSHHFLFIRKLKILFFNFLAKFNLLKNFSQHCQIFSLNFSCKSVEFFFGKLVVIEVQSLLGSESWK
jgi:hypothetical protein